VSVCACDARTVEEVASLAEKRGDYVRFSRDPADEDELPRLGRPHRLPLRKADFTDVLSIRARLQAHSGILEAQALLLAVKWVLRSASRQQVRLVLLVDAKTVVGAAAKGRSSSPGLLYIMRQLAAYILAGDLLLRLVYVPSESNPADAPSRGRRRRPALRRKIYKLTRRRPVPTWQKTLTEKLELAKRMCGSDSSSEASSSPSGTTSEQYL